jgi:hypothetical protein
MPNIDLGTLSSGILVVLASLGLSLSAGVRAYLPVLAVGLANDLNLFGIHLLPQFSWVGDPLFLGLMGLLTVYEISADKIPVVDHLNDTVHTIIRPLSGALIFTCTNNALTQHGTAGMLIAAVIGGSLAATTHVAKAAVVRPASTVTTLGIANPFISLLEDVGVVFMTLLSLIAPVVAALLCVVIAFFVIRGINTLVKRRRAKRAAGQFATNTV